MPEFQQGEGPGDDNLKSLYDGLSKKNPILLKAGFDAFKKGLEDENNLRDIYNGLSEKNHYLKGAGFDAFRSQLYGVQAAPQKTEQDPFKAPELEGGTPSGPGPLMTAEQLKKKEEVGSQPSSIGSFDTFQAPKIATETPNQLGVIPEPGMKTQKHTDNFAEALLKTVGSGLADQLPKEHAALRLAMSKGQYGDVFDRRSNINAFGNRSEEYTGFTEEDFSKWSNENRQKLSGKDYNQKAEMFLTEKLGAEGFEKFKNKFDVTNKAERLGWASEMQKQEAEAKIATAGVITNLEDVKGAGDFLNFAGGMIGQSLYRVPTSIVTGTAGSFAAESAAVYDRELQLIAEREGISVNEVIARDLDKPAAMVTLPVVMAGGLDAISSINLIGMYRKAAAGQVTQSMMQQFTKNFIKGAIPEAITEGAQGELEELAASKGADVDYKFDGWRLATGAIGGAIGGAALSGAGSLTNKKETQAEKVVPPSTTTVNEPTEQPKQQAEPVREDAGKYEFAGQQQRFTETQRQQEPVAEIQQPVQENKVQPSSLEKTETSTGPESGSVAFGTKPSSAPIPAPPKATPEQVQDLNVQEDHWRAVNNQVANEVDQKTRLIARHLQKFTSESWKRHGDKNFMSDTPAARLYMNNKKGVPLDVQAQTISKIFNPEGDGTEVTEQDIIDFVMKYPNPKFQLTIGKDSKVADTKLGASQIVDLNPDISNNENLARALRSMESTGITPENLNNPEIVSLLDNDFLFSKDDRETIRDIFDYANTEEGAKKISQLRDKIRAEVDGEFSEGSGLQEVPGNEAEGQYEIVENEKGYPAFWDDPSPQAQAEYVRPTTQPQISTAPVTDNAPAPSGPIPNAVNTPSAPEATDENRNTPPVQPVQSPAPSRVEEARARVKDRVAAIKEKWDALNTMGIISDPKERAKKHYDLHRELVLLAKDLFDAGIATVQEFATVIGRDVDDFVTRAFNDATAEREGKPVEVTSQEFFEQPSQQISGIKKALVPESVVDETAIDRRSTQDMLDRGKRLVDSGEIDPEAIINEIVNVKSRALQADEVAALVYYKAKLDAKYDSVNSQIIDAQATNDLENLTRLKGEYNFLTDRLEKYHQMSVLTAYEQSLAFRLRQMLIDGEYNLANQVRRYKVANGGTIPADMEKKFRDLDEQLKKANEKIEETENRKREEIEREVIERIQRSNERDQARGKAPRRGKALMAEGFEDLAQALGVTQMAHGTMRPSIVAALEKIGKGMIDEGLATVDNVSKKVREYVKDKFGDKINFDDYEGAMMDGLREDVNATMPSVKKGKVIIPQDFLKGLVADGVTDINDLVDRVHQIVSKSHPEITKRQVRDAITNYGKTISLSQDEIDVKLRGMKRVGKMISSLEDIQAKKRPQRSGLQRDSVSDQERQMMKQIREGMKELPQSEEDQERVWRTALDAVKTRLQNTITDLEKQIKTGVKSQKAKGIEYDQEALALREKVNALRDVLQEMEGKKQMSDEQRVRLAIAAADRGIKEYERRISSRDFAPARKPGVPLTPELVKARAQRDQLKATLEDMMKEAGIADQKRLQGYKTRVRKSIADLERRVREKDFDIPKKKDTKLDKEAQDLLTERERIKHEFDVEQEKVRLQNRPTSEKVKDFALDVWNLPKSLLSSMDLSAPLRQGAILSLSHPTSGAKSFVNMFGFLASQKKYDTWFNELKTLDLYPTIRDSKLYLSEPSAKLSAREESFMSNFATKIPGLGHAVKASERAYTGYLNVLRLDVFSQGVDQLKNQGLTPETNPEAYKAWADFINNATGRGNLGALETSAGVLNGLMFSPRYLASRINLLSPAKYAKMPPEVRKMALRDMVTYIGFGLTILALAGLAGADVEDDPRSTDFGKIRIGDTRYDIWAGFQPIIRTLMQVISGQKKNTVTGEIENLGDPEKPFSPTRLDVLGRFARTKASPAAGTTINLLQGKDFMGNEVTIEGEAVKNLIPLYIQDMKEIYQTEGAGGLAATAIPSLFGVGVQNYKSKPEDETVVEEQVEEILDEEEF